MLKDFEKNKPEEKSVLNAEIKELRSKLMGMQQQLREKKLPILVLIEGWSAAGKGSLIKELISELDPRFYNVISPVIVPESEERYPFLYPFATAIPENGSITFMDSGWMESLVCKLLRSSDLSTSLSVSFATEGIWFLNCSCTLTRLNRKSASLLCFPTWKPHGG